MNDEIKEILDRLDYNEGEVALYRVPITWCELYDIRDYIINLQQDTEMYAQLKDEYEEEIKELHENNQNMQEEMARVWEENERLKEANVYCNRTDCVGRIKDSRKYDSVYQEKEDYKSRCEKASELLKYYDPEPWSTYQITGETLLNLLNILQGENDATNKDL